MRPEWGQRVAAAWAVRGQPYPAVGAELPVAFDLTAAITALLHELVKLLLELQECRLPPALLGRWLVLLVVHGVPSVSHCLPALVSLRRNYMRKCQSLLGVGVVSARFPARRAYFFMSTSSPSAHARATAKFPCSSPGILSQPPFVMTLVRS
jgi:hypothetical protein